MKERMMKLILFLITFSFAQFHTWQNGGSLFYANIDTMVARGMNQQTCNVTETGKPIFRDWRWAVNIWNTDGTVKEGHFDSLRVHKKYAENAGFQYCTMAFNGWAGVQYWHIEGFPLNPYHDHPFKDWYPDDWDTRKFYQVSNLEVFYIQHEYMDSLMSIVDCIEIGNELPISHETREWQEHWISYIRERSDVKIWVSSEGAPLGVSWCTINNEWLFSLNADYYSPRGAPDCETSCSKEPIDCPWYVDPPYMDKKIIIDTDHLSGWCLWSKDDGLEIMTEWVWLAKIRGHTPLMMAVFTDPRYMNQTHFAFEQKIYKELSKVSGIIIFGDANLDNAVNVVDIVMMVGHINMERSLLECQIKQCDKYADGLDVVDIVAVIDVITREL